jgi:integrase
MLLNGCYVSAFTVFPANWNESGADASLEWRINYRFYDPAFKDHPQIKGVKAIKVMGMNEYTTLTDKREITAKLLALEKDQIINKGYNPITETYMKEEGPEEELDYIIHPTTPIIQALREAYKRLSVVSSTAQDIRSVINGLEAASAQLRYDNIEIGKVKRRTIIRLLDQCEKTNPKWSANRFNKYRAYLLMLFTELVSIEAIEYNPITDIKLKKGHVKEKREVLTEDERKKVDLHLRAGNYRFWLFLQVFFHSGGRETELMNLKGKDVNLDKQEINVLIKKGKQYRIESKPMKSIAVQYWQQALVNCGPDDYVFSEGLQPGTRKIRTDQITRRWKRHVKDKLEITKDFYALKHLNSDEVDAQLGLQAAAKLNSHRDTDITKIYTVSHDDRLKQAVKNISNTFAPAVE